MRRPNFCKETFATPACSVPERILSICYLGAAGAPGSQEVLRGWRKVVHGLFFHVLLSCSTSGLKHVTYEKQKELFT